MPALTRLLGAITVAYSAALIVAPKILTQPSNLTAPGAAVPRPMRTLVASIAARDTAIGAAMVFAPAGRPLRLALAARVVADVADAVIFGVMLPDRTARVRTASVAAGWAVLCAASGLQLR